MLAEPATVGDLAILTDGYAAALDRANGRTADLVAIADTCEARQRAALTALNPPPWWKRVLKHKP